MSAGKSIASLSKGPSILAMLVDDISRMSVSEQKLLWMQLHKEKLGTLARELDASVPTHQLSATDIDSLITEARKNAGKKKKG